MAEASPQLLKALGLPVDATELEVFVRVRESERDGYEVISEEELGKLRAAVEAAMDTAKDAERRASNTIHAALSSVLLDRAEHAGRILPADRSVWAAAYRDNPALVEEVLEREWGTAA